MSDSVNDVIIVGGGPAGYTAAIYAARAGLKTLLAEGVEWGGQLMQTTMIENYPGFSKGVDANDLMNEMREQAQNAGATLLTMNVESITPAGPNPTRFIVRMTNGLEYGRSVILAMGASAKWLGHPDETLFKHSGVSACATCDGPLFRGKPVVVIGGGDTAMEEALFLSRFCSEVTIVHRRAEFRASQIMLDRVKATPNIKVYTPYVLDKIRAYENTSPRQILDVMFDHAEDPASGMRIPARAVFIAIGHQPNSKIEGLEKLETDALGYVKVVPGSAVTNIQGLFAAGDVMDSRYRQAVTAAGTGCMAALEAQHYLQHDFSE